MSEHSSLRADLSKYLGKHGDKTNLQVRKKLWMIKTMCCSQTTECCAMLAELYWCLQQMSTPSLLLLGIPAQALLLRALRGRQHQEAFTEENKVIKSLCLDEWCGIERSEFSTIHRHLLSAIDLCHKFDKGEVSKTTFLDLDRQFLSPAFSGDFQQLAEFTPASNPLPWRTQYCLKKPLFRR